MTGPVPGFVAFYAKAMVDYATAQRIAPKPPHAPLNRPTCTFMCMDCASSVHAL